LIVSDIQIHMQRQCIR